MQRRPSPKLSIGWACLELDQFGDETSALPLSWNESYDAPVLDGEQWRLLWHGRECSGSNAYPPEFDIFVAGIAGILGLPEL